MVRLLILLISVFLLPACNSVPPTNIHQPMTARPAPRNDALANGSIYQAGSSRSLFEDRRARYVGDTMTIVIAEATSASSKSSTNVSRASSINASVPIAVGRSGNTSSFQGLSLGAESGNTLAGKGDAAANNVFTGNITVTVVDIMPNGNLLVSGEKQVSIGHGTEFIRLSGVVNPYFISSANTISSANVADARIEYKETGAVSEAQIMGWLARFFMTVVPF